MSARSSQPRASSPRPWPSVAGHRSAVSAAAADVPPLEQGDRLTRDEFERRYNAMPESFTAHLLDGVVHVDDFAGRFSHGRCSSMLSGGVVGRYVVATPLVHAGVKCSLRLDEQNEPQPDLAVWIDRRAGGQTVDDADGFLAGAPELITEIALNSSSIDVQTKLHVYRRAGVREYLVWPVRDGAVDWYERSGSDFVLKSPGEDGVLKSTVFPGLWLDAAALLAGDLARVIATLNGGLASAEHEVFVAMLRAAAADATAPKA